MKIEEMQIDGANIEFFDDYIEDDVSTIINELKIIIQNALRKQIEKNTCL